MRLGDIRGLAFDIEPVSPSWERRTASERGPWARLAIWAGGQNFCLNWRPETSSVNDGVYVPLAPIADWLLRYGRHIAYEESSRAFPTDVDLIRALERWKASAPAALFSEDDWDDRRYEWSERHFLLAGADGAWLPNLALVRVDNELWISVGSARFASPQAPRFLKEFGVYPASWQDAKQAISEFVDYVGQTLRDSDLTQEYPWSQEEGAFLRALDIGLLEQLALELDRSQQEVADIFGASSEPSLLEMLGLPSGATARDSVSAQAIRDLELEQGIIGILRECERATRSAENGLFRESRLRAVDALSGPSPEDQGYEAAVLIRRNLKLGDRPLGDDPESLLKEHFNIEVAELPNNSHHNHAVIGGHLDGFGKIGFFQSPQTQKPWSRRMELFRGVGHLLLDGRENLAIGAGSSNRSVGPRRRRSGAFAAEMLLPKAAIRKRCGGVLDAAAEPNVFEGLMADYGVGAQTAAWQCWNAGLLSSYEVVDELIGAYGAGTRS
jgi:hypothetical protein